MDAKVLEFGTSGLLYRSNKLMYDRGTNTLWTSFYGQPAVGPLADSAIKLELLPVLVTTWGEWLDTHPDTTVLDDDTGVYPAERYPPEDDPRSLYADYRADPDTMFPVAKRSDLLTTKAQVLGLSVEGRARAYPLETLRDNPIINDSLGGKNLVIVTKAEAGAARPYERGHQQFSIAEPGGGEGEVLYLVDEAGGRWRMEEDALVQEDDPSQRLLRIPSHMSYWFGWYAFYPDTDVYVQEPPES